MIQPPARGGAAAPAKPVRPHFSKRILHPTTGVGVYAQFPAYNSPQVSFVGGPIVLRYGRHYGKHSGWGLEHIWREHFRKHTSEQSVTVAVCDLLSAVLVPGADILYEYNIGSGANRSTVFKSRAGLVIVEERMDDRHFPVVYSIVTAFGRQSPHGTLITKL